MEYRETQDGNSGDKMIEITQDELETELKKLGESRDILTEKEARRWAMRQRGMTYGQISLEEGVNAAVIARCVICAEGKLRKSRL